MLREIRFRQDKMKKALNEGFVLATDLADYLASKGVSFRQAHRIVGEMVRACQERECDLSDLTLEEMRAFDAHFTKDVFEWLDYQHALDRRASLGGTAQKNIKQEIKKARNDLQKNEKKILQMQNICSQVEKLLKN